MLGTPSIIGVPPFGSPKINNFVEAFHSGLFRLAASCGFIFQPSPPPTKSQKRHILLSIDEKAKRAERGDRKYLVCHQVIRNQWQLGQ